MSRSVLAACLGLLALSALPGCVAYPAHGPGYYGPPRHHGGYYQRPPPPRYRGGWGYYR